MKKSFFVLVIVLVVSAGCVQPPRTAPDDPAVYRPQHPIAYPLPK